MKLRLVILLFLFSIPSVGQVNYDIKHIRFDNVFLTPDFVMMDSIYRANFTYPIENYLKKSSTPITPIDFNEYRAIIYYKFKSSTGSQIEVFDDYYIKKTSDTDYLIQSNFTNHEYQRSKSAVTINNTTLDFKRMPDNAFVEIYNTLETLDSNKFYRQFSNYGCIELSDCHEKAYMLVYKNGKLIYGIFSLGMLIINRQTPEDISMPGKSEVKKNLQKFK